jgi:hypothetical protein
MIRCFGDLFNKIFYAFDLSAIGWNRDSFGSWGEVREGVQCFNGSFARGSLP